MDLIEEIKTRLSKYPGVRYESTGSSITVFPATEDGFEVGLQVHGSEYLISFDAWHVELELEEDALELFALGLSDQCRLREYRRGSFAYKWTMEYLADGEWTEDETTALLVFPFWRRSTVRYLQNRFLTFSTTAEPAGLDR